MSNNSNNTDFQSQLLRMNSSLQEKIIGLRYHCEVYRLSLKTICKVLGSVQKDQDVRLRCLASSTRPSFQAYLLNLSQKQALDRIKNVVRKASTFINGYSLVDKRLFLPPPPKPSASRLCGNENKTAAATSNTGQTDGTGSRCVSKSCLVGPGSGAGAAAAGLNPVIAEEVTANKGCDGAEVATSKNNDGREERKRRYSSSTKRKRSKEEKKKTSERRSKSNNRTRIKSSHKHSSSSSTGGGDSKNKGSGSSSAIGSDGRKNGGVKRNRSEKIRSRSSSRNCLSSSADSTKNKHRFSEENAVGETRPKSITTRNQYDNHHHHHRRQKVINFRTLTIHHDAELEEDNEIEGASFIPGKSNKEYEQHCSLMRQSGSTPNRIPPLLSIATSSAMKINKTSGTPYINEKLRTEARRVCRPSKEIQYEGRRTNNDRKRTNSQTNDTKTNTAVSSSSSSSNRNTRSIFTIRRREVYESNTVTTARQRGTSTSSTRGRGVASTTTAAATKAGYKVRESLAVVRNRKYGNVRQGQGIVARKHVFSSQKPGNNFKLNPGSTAASSALVIEKVRRVQLNGNRRYSNNSFSTVVPRSVNEEKVYEMSRKFTNGTSGNGNNP